MPLNLHVERLKLRSTKIFALSNHKKLSRGEIFTVNIKPLVKCVCIDDYSAPKKQTLVKSMVQKLSQW
jgi:hypothetical protein